MHTRSLTSKFAPEKWMDGKLQPPFWIRWFSPKKWEKNNAWCAGREKLSNKIKFHFLYKLHLFNWNLPFNIIGDAITTGDSWYLRSLDVECWTFHWGSLTSLSKKWFDNDVFFGELRRSYWSSNHLEYPTDFEATKNKIKTSMFSSWPLNQTKGT